MNETLLAKLDCMPSLLNQKLSSSSSWNLYKLRMAFCSVAAIFFIASISLGTNVEWPKEVLESNSVEANHVKQHDEIKRYKNQILVAGLAIDSGNFDVAKKLLADTNPSLRDWEFGYLQGELNQSGKKEKEKLTNEGYAVDATFSPDGRNLIFGRGNDVVIWDFVNDKSVKLMGHQGSVASVAVDPAGEKIATGGTDGKILVWDVASREKILEYTGHNPMNRRSGAKETQVVRDLCFSPEGEKIVSTAYVNSPFADEIKPEVKIWSVESGRTITSLHGDHDWGRSFSILCVAFSPDGSRIATGSFDKNVRIWNARTGREIRAIEGHSNNVLGVAFSPDSKRLASASTDGTLAVWDVATGKELTRLTGHKNPVFSVQFSHSGKRIISGCCDQTVKIWHAETGLELLSLSEPGAMIRSIAISEDDRWIAAGRSGENRQGVTVWKSEIED